MPKPVINTDRLILRPFCSADKDDTIAILTDNCVNKTYMLPDFPTPQDAEPLFLRLKALSEDSKHCVFAITLNDKVIGFMNDVEINDTEIEIGYAVNPAYHNRGYATEALVALIDYLHNVGFTIVKAGYFQENTASRRVMEKAGMKKSPYEDDIEYHGQMHHCLYFESIRQNS